MSEWDVIVPDGTRTRSFRVAADSGEEAGRIASEQCHDPGAVAILPAKDGSERGLANGEVVEVGKG